MSRGKCPGGIHVQEGFVLSPDRFLSPLNVI